MTAIRPPFTAESAWAKVQADEDAWYEWHDDTNERHLPERPPPPAGVPR